MTCTAPTANNWGIEFQAGGNTVRNGAVRGFFAGVRYFGADQIENVLVEHNSVYGVLSAGSDGGSGFVGSRVVVFDCVSVENKQFGFTGGNIVVGRTMAESNNAGDYLGTVSAGGNIKGTSSIPF